MRDVKVFDWRDQPEEISKLIVEIMESEGSNDDGIIEEQGPPTFWHIVAALKEVVPRLKMIFPPSRSTDQDFLNRVREANVAHKHKGAYYSVLVEFELDVAPPGFMNFASQNMTAHGGGRG